MDRRPEVPQKARRGRKRKRGGILEDEQIIQIYGNEETPLAYLRSSSLLPARPLEAAFEPVAAAPVIKKDSKPIIKKEVVETDVSTTESNAMQVNTNVTLETTDIIKELKDIQNLCYELLADPQQLPQTTNSLNMEKPIEPNNELSFSHGFNLQNVKPEPDFPAACTANSTFDDSNYCEPNVGNLDLTEIKCEPRSRSSSTETVLADESQQLPLAEYQSDETTEKILLGTSETVKQVKIEPQSIYSVEQDATREMEACSDTHEADLINNPLAEDRVALNNDSQMDFQMASTSVEENTINLRKIWHNRSDLSNSCVTSVVTNSSEVGKTSSVSLSQEIANMSFVSPMPSPNACVSKSKDVTMQMSTRNIAFETKLNKYFKLETDQDDVKDCLNYLHSAYPSTNNFSLFFSFDTLQRQCENAAVEPVKSSPTNSNIIKELLSTDMLKKIIETTSLPNPNSPNFPLPLQNNIENYIVKDTKNTHTLSVCGSISHLPTLSTPIKNQTIIFDQDLTENIPIKDASSIVSSAKSSAEETTAEMHDLTKTIKSQSVISDQTFSRNIRIKDEPFDDYDAVVSSPTVSHYVSTCDKRSAEKTATEFHTLTKKIKLSPDHSALTTGYSFDNQIKLRDGTEKFDSADQSSKGIQSRHTLEVTHNISNTLKSRALTPQNSRPDKNTVSNTEKTRISPSNSIPYIGKSGEAKNLIVKSDQSFNPKIHVKTKCFNVCQTSNISSVFQQSSTTCVRSTEETASNMRQAIKINTVAEPQDHSVASVADDAITTSKVSTSCSLIPQSVLCVKNTVPITNNSLQNNTNMIYASSVSDSKNSKAIASKSITSKLIQKKVSSSDKVPNTTGDSKNSTAIASKSITSKLIQKKVSISDKAPNTTVKTNLFVEPSTSVSSNLTVVTTVSDSVITSNNTNSIQRTPVINRFFTPNARQHVEKTNLGCNRIPSDVNNTPACNRINTQPGIISHSNETTRKKIAAEKYLRRNSTFSHDPRLQKSISQNAVSQISSTDASLPLLLKTVNTSVVNQQNHNRTPIACSQNAHQYKSTSTSSAKISSNVQQKSFQNSIAMTAAHQTPQRSVALTHIKKKRKKD